MIVRIFKSNQHLVNLLAVLLLVLVWYGNYFFRTLNQSDLSFGVLWLDVLLGVMLVSFQAIFLSYTVNYFKLLNETSYLPSLLLVFFNCSSIFSFSLNQILVANTFIVLAIYQLLKMYNKENKFSLLFNTGILVGLASVFYMPCIVYFILLWVVIVYLTTPKWRDFVISLIGLLLPLIYYLAYFYVFRDLSELSLYDDYLSPSSFELIKASFWVKTYIALFFILTFISCVYLLFSLGRNVVRIRKMLFVILLILFAGTLTLFINQNDLKATLLIITPALSIIVANFLQHIKKSLISELIFMLMLFTLTMSYFS